MIRSALARAVFRVAGRPVCTHYRNGVPVVVGVTRTRLDDLPPDVRARTLPARLALVRLAVRLLALALLLALAGCPLRDPVPCTPGEWPDPCAATSRDAGADR